MDKRLIGKFIEIGQKENFEALKTMFSPEETISKGEIMRQGWDKWYDLVDTLEDEEIAALMKTFTIAEKALGGWNAGSVSPVIWLGIKLKERKFEQLDELREWVKKNGAHDWLTQRW